MKKEPGARRAYLLRFWTMDNDGCPQWRLSLEDAQGETVIRFASIAELVVFLLKEMEGSARPLAAGNEEDPRS